MPEVRFQVVKWQFHPKPQTRPIAVELVCPEEKGKKYVTFRNKGGGKLNTFRTSAYPLPTIMKNTGVQYYGTQNPRQFVALSVLKVCSSYPNSFLWYGNDKEVTDRIGNSVPPNLMRAIAENIRRAPFMQSIKNPTVISTFAGCGGSSLGYKLAGFQELLAVEWDDNAVETFKLNFPGVPVFHGDIAKLTGAECMRLAGGIAPGELDVLDGSPPCQGFSTAGKRKFDDPRNSLFKEFARLLRELQPRVFVMENVTGMVKGAMKQAYLTIIEELRQCGYQCKGEVMNAMYFNVPQNRERVIIIGVRNDLSITPTHPKPQTMAMTFGAALDVIELTGDQHRAASERVLEYGRHHPGGWNTNMRLMMQLSGKSHSVASLKWAERHLPLGTIIKQEIVDSGIMHPNRVRYLSKNELTVGASFPSSFKFSSRKKAIERIGNSVPPNLMRAIAEHVRKNILCRYTGAHAGRIS